MLRNLALGSILQGIFQRQLLNLITRTTAYGASCPFPWVLANVPSPNPQQPFAACNGTGAPRPALIDLLPGDHEKEKYELKKDVALNPALLDGLGTEAPLPGGVAGG